MFKLKLLVVVRDDTVMQRRLFFSSKTGSSFPAVTLYLPCCFVVFFFLDQKFCPLAHELQK